MGTDAPVPLVFEPIVLEKVWGGRRLARLGKALARAEARYGESWEIADLAATSVSGAGGGAARSVVEKGSLRGRGIGEALAAVGGPRPFPLLIKYLDAGESLSVQVHPSPAAAAADRGAHLKTESWYVVEAEPGASLYIGVKAGVTRERFEGALRSGGRGVVDLLERVEAVPGRCHTLPSGIVHALGAGVLVAEVQTPSDTTYRLYDWGRDGREMHVEAGLASAFDERGGRGEPTVNDAPSAGPLAEGELCARLAETAHYTIDEVRLQGGDEATVGFPCRYGTRHAGEHRRDERGFVLMAIDGTGELGASGGGFESVGLAAGRTVYVPPGCARESVLRAAGDSSLRVLRVGVLGADAQG